MRTTAFHYNGGDFTLRVIGPDADRPGPGRIFTMTLDGIGAELDAQDIEALREALAAWDGLPSESVPPSPKALCPRDNTPLAWINDEIGYRCPRCKLFVALPKQTA